GFVGALEQVEHVLVDVGAIAVRLVDGRPRDVAALRPRVTVADGVVVGVVQVRVAWIRRLVIRHVRLQQEGFEKPAHVRQVPLGRTAVRHGLDDVVLDRKGCAQRFREVADLLVTLDQRLALLARPWPDGTGRPVAKLAGHDGQPFNDAARRGRSGIRNRGAGLSTRFRPALRCVWTCKFNVTRCRARWLQIPPRMPGPRGAVPHSSPWRVAGPDGRLNWYLPVSGNDR